MQCFSPRKQRFQHFCDMDTSTSPPLPGGRPHHRHPDQLPKPRGKGGEGKGDRPSADYHWTQVERQEIRLPTEQGPVSVVAKKEKKPLKTRAGPCTGREVHGTHI